MTAVVWFRRDLRLGNNPAWIAATREHSVVMPLFILDPHLWQHAGPHRGPQLAAHLGALDEELESRSGRLHVAHGTPQQVLTGLASDTIYWNDDYSPYARRRDDAVAAALANVNRFDGNVVQAPDSLWTKSGSPFQVFTPYSKAWAAAPLAEYGAPEETTLTTSTGDGIPATPPPLMPGGEEAAHDRLLSYLEHVDKYRDVRDRPDLDLTSRLSADLKFGTISPLDIIAACGDDTPGRAAFVRQLCWRDFWAQILYHQPHTATGPMRPVYQSLKWRNDMAEFAAWQEGRTGYPIVDAGMRQLQTEGWMHNRVRMIVGSFLVKHLLVDWRWGERHFRHLLVDGDMAQNIGNWQWVAGTGADAAPYFRIFNPITQSEKFDPDGTYIRRYVPELREVPTAHIHRPWEAPPQALLAANVTIGDEYPDPLVDHSMARQRALDAYAAARN